MSFDLGSIGIDTTPWTVEALYREKDRRLAEDLAAMGPRPPWWRRRARRSYDLRAQYLKKAHASDLRTMLAANHEHRAIVAHLIGWRQS